MGVLTITRFVAGWFIWGFNKKNIDHTQKCPQAASSQNLALPDMVVANIFSLFFCVTTSPFAAANPTPTIRFLLRGRTPVFVKYTLKFMWFFRMLLLCERCPMRTTQRSSLQQALEYRSRTEIHDCESIHMLAQWKHASCTYMKHRIPGLGHICKSFPPIFISSWSYDCWYQQFSIRFNTCTASDLLYLRTVLVYLLLCHWPKFVCYFCPPYKTAICMYISTATYAHINIHWLMNYYLWIYTHPYTCKHIALRASLALTYMNVSQYVF